MPDDTDSPRSLPALRARARSRCARAPRPRAGALPRCRVPSPCTSSSPNGAVGSSTSAEHLREERLVLLPGSPQPRLRHEVAERQRRRQFVAAAAQQMRLDFRAAALPASCDRRQVMDQLAAPPSVPALRPRAMNSCQQRRLPHIQPVVARIEARAQLRGDVSRRGIEAHLLDGQRRLAPHHLHRLGQPFPHHRRAQDVVPIDHRLQRLHVALQRARAVEAHISRPTGTTSPSLPAGDGTECLPAAAPADRCPARWRHRPAPLRRSASISSWLRLHQRQHLRRDRLAARAGIRFGGTATACRSPARSRRSAASSASVGVVEQRPHIQRANPAGASARSDCHRQQRVPAQLEEVVVAADALDAQHLRPDPRRASARPRPRRFVLARDDTHRDCGRRQRLAVQLAVRRQRQAPPAAHTPPGTM